MGRGYKEFWDLDSFLRLLKPRNFGAEEEKEIGRERAERLKGQKTTRSSLEEVSSAADFEIGEMEKPL